MCTGKETLFLLDTMGGTPFNEICASGSCLDLTLYLQYVGCEIQKRTDCAPFCRPHKLKGLITLSLSNGNHCYGTDDPPCGKGACCMVYLPITHPCQTSSCATQPSHLGISEKNRYLSITKCQTGCRRTILAAQYSSF